MVDGQWATNELGSLTIAKYFIFPLYGVIPSGELHIPTLHLGTGM
jgi:hypothetical protein